MTSSVTLGMNQITYTLEADSYISPEIHKKELEAIFYRTWQYACHSSQLKKPGDYFAFSVGTQELVVVLGKDELVRAFFNVCPHRAHPLVQGCGNKQILVCPNHAWTFFLNGQLYKARGSENIDGFDPARFNLTEARIEEFMGFYFVNLDEKSPPLKSLSGQLETEIRQTFGDLRDLDLVASRSIEGAANWKVLIDNHMDGSPDLIVSAVTHSIYTRIRNDLWWLWPNWFICKLPDNNGVAISVVRSFDSRRSREELQVFYPKLEKADAAEKWLQNEVHAQNMMRSEQVQIGMGSRAFQRGPLFVNRERHGMSEHALVHFHALVRDALSRLKISSKTLRPSSREANAPV